MQVSVIIPNYNHEQYLEQRLESVFNQSYRNFEVILLDDASTDGSREILKQYSERPEVAHFVVNQENSGSPFSQWKKGFELVSGDLIWIAESDDFADLDLLASLVLFFNDPEVVIAYGQSYDVDQHGNKLFSRKDLSDKLNTEQWASEFSMHGPEFIEKYMIHANVIPNASAVLFRSSMVDHIDQEAYEVRRVGDWITWCSMLRHGKVAFTPKILNYFRFSPNNTRGNDRLRILEYTRTLLCNKTIISKKAYKDKLNRYLWDWVRAHHFFSLFKNDYYRFAQITPYTQWDLQITYFKNLYGQFLKRVIWTYFTKRKDSRYKREQLARRQAGERK